MRNPLNNSNGKSDIARNCYSKKFRNNFDEIKWSKNNTYWMDGLTVKECNSICRYDIKSKHELLQLIRSAKLNPYSYKWKYFGVKPYRSICNFLKLKPLY